MSSGENLQVTYHGDGLEISLESRGISARKNNRYLRLRLEGIGKGEEELRPLAELEPGRVSTDENYLEVNYDEFRIEYLDLPQGTRQNFIVERAPAGNGPLRVRLRAEGDLRPIIKGEDDAIFVHGSEEIIEYTGLKVWDADGRELAAHMEASGDLLALVVDDAGAKYPVTVDPLLSDADWVTPSNASSNAVNAGDVNNDGYDDLIVGGSGRAQIFHGSTTGLGTNADWTVLADQANSGFGGDVASAGDINNDGYDDVMVSASLYDNGQSDEGRVYVYYGSPAGVNTTPAWTGEINISNAMYGNRVASAGDVNNDGYGDIIISTEGGRVYGYYGSASGLPSAPNWTSNLPSNPRFCDISSAGDVNSDGYDDVIIGTPWYTSSFRPEEGAIFIYYGSATGLGPTHNWMVKGNIKFAQFGTSVAAAGDVNGDGYDDVIAGLPGLSSFEPGRGRVYLFLGSPTGPPVVPAWISALGGIGELYGQSVAGLGDVNGDGYDDVAVGSPRYEYNKYFVQTGAAFLFYGSPTTMSNIPAWTISGYPSALRLGWPVAGAGDVNGDGYNELIAGESGKAYVFYGELDTVSRDLTGQVVDHQGNPISGAVVLLDNLHSATTSANGRFLFDGPVPQGSHNLRVSATGFQTATFDLVMPNSDKHVVLGLNPTGNPPTGPYTICGTVTESDGNGPPLSGVLVEIIQGGFVITETSTDSQGKFCSAPLDGGTYQVRFSKSGYQTFTTDLNLNSNKQIVVSLAPSNLQ